MPENANHTREALLDAAERLFSARGYAGVGIREIAEQAGANIASISYHFGSKHALYLQTVRRAMGRHGGEEIAGLLATPAPTARGAAVQLVRFVRLFCAGLAARPEIETCGALIVREALHPSEAIDAVVQDYLLPRMTELVSVLQMVVPDAPEDEVRRFADLIFAQLIYHRIFRPILERLGNRNFSDPNTCDQLADDIVRFTLRGLGCGKEWIDRALAEADAAALMASGEQQR